MRITAVLLGIAGGLLAGALGAKWLSDYGQLNEMQRAMGGAELQSIGTAGLLLLGSCLLGIVGGILAIRRKFVVAAGLMLAGSIVPLLFASQAIIFVLPLLAGGVVAAAAHFKGEKLAHAT